MKSVWRAVAVGAAAYLAFLLVNIPAAWVIDRLAGRAPQVQLSGVGGTLWSGRASQLRVDAVTLGDVRWRWHPFALLAGRLEYGLSGRWGESPVMLSAGKGLFGGAYLSDVSVAAPARNWIGALHLPAEASGELTLALDRVRFTQGGAIPALRGTARWAPAVLAAPVALELGRVDLELTPDGDLTRGKVTAQGGVLRVDGNLELDPSGEYRLDAAMTPTGQISDDIRAGLDAVAEFHDGRYRLDWKDSLH